jgi:hypothetical protein
MGERWLWQSKCPSYKGDPIYNEVILYALIFETCCSYRDSEVSKYAKAESNGRDTKRYRTPKPNHIFRHWESWIVNGRDGDEASSLLLRAMAFQDILGEC